MPLNRESDKSVVKIVRMDAAHAGAGGPAASRSSHVRRVREAMAASAGARNQRRRVLARSLESASLRLCSAEESDTAESSDSSPVIEQFRNNFHALSHIARDPLVWNSEERIILADLRETLSLTQSALLQFETMAANQTIRSVAGEGIVALAHVVEEKTDELFDRIERLTGLRQRVLRLSAILESVRGGTPPRTDEIEIMATELVEGALQDPALTLVQVQSEEQAVQVAAHCVNVAETVARLALSDPVWREEGLLAASSALLQDLGMMQVPAEIYDLQESLSGPQRTFIRQHPAASAAIVQQMHGRDERLIAAVYQHHERLDGSGYPARERGDAINSVARLLAVADTYVGMQSPRAYRPALNAAQALCEIERAATEGRLDPAWTSRLPKEPPRWLRIRVQPKRPTGAPAISALAA